VQNVKPHGESRRLRAARRHALKVTKVTPRRAQASDEPRRNDDEWWRLERRPIIRRSWHGNSNIARGLSAQRGHAVSGGCTAAVNAIFPGSLYLLSGRPALLRRQRLRSRTRIAIERGQGGMMEHRRIARIASAVGAIAIAAGAPLHAQIGHDIKANSRPSPYPYPYAYPYLPIVPKAKVRCEQDRLLTDTTPCGEETAEPVVIAPKKLKRCEQDRLLTDTTPCEPQ
jgi:hypothetical protein